MCNREVKFGAFWRWAEKQGADYIATGHYARSVYVAFRRSGVSSFDHPSGAAGDKTLGLPKLRRREETAEPTLPVLSARPIVWQNFKLRCRMNAASINYSLVSMPTKTNPTSFGP